jgi:tetraacyldisaccharide 4'-kinase
MRTPQFWQQPNLLQCALLPASLLYRAGAWLDRRLTTPKRAPIPVIAIGNVTAGGAGKTPTAIALVAILQSLGHTPHILTRGYGGAKLSAHRVQADDDWRKVGDEALLLAAAAPTWVGRDRLKSAQAAAAAGASIVVCDDALQHYALNADIHFLIIDGPYGIGNGALLPAGPLRETLASASKRCDAAIIIGADAQHLATRLAMPIFHGSIAPSGDTASLTSHRWLAFAGIGRPEKFYTTLRELGAELVATQDFADHHPYSERDVNQLIQRATSLNAQLITTTKDAVKIPAKFQKQVAKLPISLTMKDPEHLRDFVAQRHSLLKPA